MLQDLRTGPFYLFFPHKKTYREYLLQIFFSQLKKFKYKQQVSGEINSVFSRTIEYYEEVKMNRLDTHILTWKNLK